MIIDNVSNLLAEYKPEEIAKYIRLSLEDKGKGADDESESVTNQRLIINQFIDMRGNIGSKCREFIDDGKSGTNFERPGWKELIDEVENRTIKVIITKNLSRLGRSNFECSYYIDHYFPLINVRYLTVQECVDTGNIYNSANDYAPINNFMNEKYSRDLSKNIKNSKRLKQENGEFVGGCSTPYGYKRDDKIKNHLLIDEYPAQIVRKIYNWYIESGSQHYVVKKLYEEKILTPSRYKNGYGRAIVSRDPYTWTTSTVKDILTSQMYIGNMEQHKFEKVSFRSSKTVRVKKENWIIKEGTHEPIIDKEKFEKVQAMIETSSRNCILNKEPELLSGLLVCHDCKHVMNIATVNRKRANGTSRQLKYTQCCFYRRTKHLGLCTLHSHNYAIFEANVLDLLEKICKKFIHSLNYDKMVKEKNNKISSYEEILNKKIEKFDSEIIKIDRKIEKLYADRLDEIISVDTYHKLSIKFESQKSQMSEELLQLQETCRKYKEENSLENILEAKQLAKEFIKKRKHVDRDLILKLVDKIEVYEGDELDLHLKIKPLENIKDIINE